MAPKAALPDYVRPHLRYRRSLSMGEKEVPLRYTGPDRANVDYHHGALRPAVGVQSYQVLRANREHPEEAEGTGWTYNHSPMLAYWKGRFYLEYLSNPVAEHTPPGHTLLTTSKDGRHWSKPEVIFPVYEVPEGVYQSEGKSLVGKGFHAIMHQRMGFYVAPNGRLLVLGFYGVSPEPHLVPFDTRGIGRVVREIYEPGTFGPVYFIRYNRHAGRNDGNTSYSYFSESDDLGFKEPCEALLEDRLVVQQWLEEHGDRDELITLKGSYKAFSYYTLVDGRVVGLWKWSKGGISRDRGHSWEWVGTVPSIETAGAKVWGQRTSDGKYAWVYNPVSNNKHRWPLAVVTGEDGLEFDKMLLVSRRGASKKVLRWGLQGLRTQLRSGHQRGERLFAGRRPLVGIQHEQGRHLGEPGTCAH